MWNAECGIIRIISFNFFEFRIHSVDMEMAEEQPPEFWRWTESNWKNPDVDWNNAKYITAGIDVGSVSSQAVIMADGQIYAYGNMRTGSDSPNSAGNALIFDNDLIVISDF